MSTESKITIIISVIILLIFSIIFAVYSHFRSKPMDANMIVAENIVPNANDGLDNMINSILNEENVQNNTENVNNEEENKQENAQNASNTTNTATSDGETDDDSSTTPREKKAIELVKEEWKREWGNLSGVFFNNIGIQSDGKYRVSVNNSKTTEVLQFYIVDVDTGVVKEK